MSTAKKTVYLSISNTIQVLISILVSVSLARIIENKSDFGRFQQVFVIINFLTSVLAAFPNSLSYFFGFYLDDSEKHDAIKRFFLSSLIAAVLIGFLGFCLKGFLGNSLDNILFSQFIILVVGITILRLILGYFVNFYLVIDKLIYYAKVNIVYFLLTGTLVFLSFKYSLSVGEILALIFIIDLFRFILLYPYINKFLWRKGNYIIRKRELTYLMPVMGVLFITSLNLYTDRFVISLLLDASAFADYQVGAFVFPFIGIVTGSVVTVLLPKIVTNYQQGKYDLIIQDVKNAAEKIAVILVPIFVYCCLFGKELITFLYSDKFETSGVIFQIYTIRFFGAIILFAMIMNAIGLEKWLLTNSIVNLLISLILNFIFIKYFGVMGAVYSAIIGTYIGYILPVYLVNKQLRTTLLDYFPLKSYFKILIVSLVLASLFKYIYIYAGFPKIWAIIFSIIYYGIALVIINKFIHQIVDVKKIFRKFFQLS